VRAQRERGGSDASAQDYMQNADCAKVTSRVFVNMPENAQNVPDVSILEWWGEADKSPSEISALSN
jgi:hypothetical protein